MAKKNLDLNDAVVSPFFVLASGVQAGLFSLVLFGFDFAAPIFTIGSGVGAIQLTIAKSIAIGALAVALATNKPNFSAMGGLQVWVAVATIGLILAPPFSPMLQSFIQTNAVAGIVALVVQSAGYYTLSYLG